MNPATESAAPRPRTGRTVSLRAHHHATLERLAEMSGKPKAWLLGQMVEALADMYEVPKADPAEARAAERKRRAEVWT